MSDRSFPARATISSPSSSRSVFERLCDDGPGPQSDLPNPAPTDDGLPSLAAVGLNSRTISFKPVEIWGTGDARADHHADAGRSEEHTSELQSLMRISYAVFCLKKKKKKQNKTSRQNNIHQTRKIN